MRNCRNVCKIKVLRLGLNEKIVLGNIINQKARIVNTLHSVAFVFLCSHAYCCRQEELRNI